MHPQFIKDEKGNAQELSISDFEYVAEKLKTPHALSTDDDAMARTINVLETDLANRITANKH